MKGAARPPSFEWHTRDFVNVCDVVQASLKATKSLSIRGTGESLTEYLAWAREEVTRG
jgi:hypothetical protein